MVDKAGIVAADPLIRCRGLTKRFDTASGPVLALKDLSFDINRGEFVSVVGQSGCGKSTLMRVMAGLAPATSGVVEIAGAPVLGPSDDCAIVFQAPVLLPWRDALENVLLPLELKGLSASAHRDRALDLLAVVGLKDFARKRPYELSGGMQQRVAIARALVQRPKLILMDEPFGALDAMSREQMNGELLRIWAATGATVVFITHSVAEAVFLSDRVIAMTARPGAIAEALAIDLPRPRPLSVINTPAFGGYADRLRHLLNATGAMF